MIGQLAMNYRPIGKFQSALKTQYYNNIYIIYCF
jgi:hypothetical protein